MTSQLQVLDVVVNIPCNDQVHCLYKEWLPSGKCPLKTAGNIRKLSEVQPGQWSRLTRITFHQNSLPRSLGSNYVNNMNGMEDDKLWVEYHEENSTSSDESVGSN